MTVKSTEIQNNFGKYLELAGEQEIVITRNGTAVARLIGIHSQDKSLSEQLRGIIPVGTDEKSLKAERLSLR